MFANLQTIDERNAVENLAVQVPVEHQLRISVVEELHVVDEVIHIVFVDIREIRLRHDEERERNLVPLRTSCEVEVHASPRVEPYTLTHAYLCEVVGVITGKSFQTHGVGNAINRSFLVHQDTSLFRIDVGDTRLVLERHRKICHVEEIPVEVGEIASAIWSPRCDGVGLSYLRLVSVRHWLIEEMVGGLCLAVAKLCLPLEAIFPFAVENQLETAIVHHVLHRRPRQCTEHIVLICVEILVGWYTYVIRVVEDEVGSGKFHGQISLLLERIGHFSHTFPASVAEAIRQVTTPKEVGIEIRCGLC